MLFVVLNIKTPAEGSIPAALTIILTMNLKSYLLYSTSRNQLKVVTCFIDHYTYNEFEILFIVLNIKTPAEGSIPVAVTIKTSEH